MIMYMKCHVLCMCALVRISWVRARQRMDQAMIHHLMIKYLKMVNHSLDQCVDFQGFESYDLIHLKYEIIVWNQALRARSVGPNYYDNVHEVSCFMYVRACAYSLGSRAPTHGSGYDSPFDDK